MMMRVNRKREKGTNGSSSNFQQKVLVSLYLSSHLSFSLLSQYLNNHGTEKIEIESHRIYDGFSDQQFKYIDNNNDWDLNPVRFR